MKDALGHGSDAHAAAALASGPKSARVPVHTGMMARMSDRMYHDTMPIANYTGQVQDMLGMWSGTQKPSPLSDDEKQFIGAAYEKRASWRELAGQVADRREARDPAWEAKEPR